LLVLTASRSGMAGLAAALVVLGIGFRAEVARARAFVGGLFAALGVALAAGIWLDGERLGKFASIAHPGRLLGDLKVRSWFDVPALIRDFPLSGVGRGAFEMVFPFYKRVPERVTFTHAENVLLQLPADLGVLVAG